MPIEVVVVVDVDEVVVTSSIAEILHFLLIVRGKGKVFSTHEVQLKYSQDMLSWNNEEAFCVTKNAHLTSITSAAENDFVNMLFADINGFNAFNLGKSNDSDGSEPCIQAFELINPTDPGRPPGKWNDATCSELRGYVCKAPIQFVG